MSQYHRNDCAATEELWLSTRTWTMYFVIYRPINYMLFLDHIIRTVFRCPMDTEVLTIVSYFAENGQLTVWETWNSPPKVCDSAL